eukprot:gene10853-22654_t
MDLLSSSISTPRKFSIEPRRVLETPLNQSSRSCSQNDTKVKSSSHISKHTPFIPKTPGSMSNGDRFISNRSTTNFDYCNWMLLDCQDENVMSRHQTNEAKTPCQAKYINEILTVTDSLPGKRLLDCFDKTAPQSDAKKWRPTLRDTEDFTRKAQDSPSKSVARSITSGPSRVLDAPDLMNDYYLNLLSWGKNNSIAIALKQTLYLWNATDKSINDLVTLDNNDYITSVQWSTELDNVIAVGTSENTVQIWDVVRQKKLRELHGHVARVSSLSWNSHQISSGSRDSTILNFDLRSSSRHAQSTYIGHQQEVCGLSWSPDGTTLASGGNDNTLCLWDAAMSERSSLSEPNTNTNSHSPRCSIQQHQAAVKALAWCPFQRNILASGGGTADRTIRIWNTATGTNIRCTDTGSQVCALQWSDTYKELVSSHGFSDNQLCLWKYPTMTKIREFRGHTSRVLHMAKSPDGTSIVSAGADETLRFWDIFSSEKSNSATKDKQYGRSSLPCGRNSFLDVVLVLEYDCIAVLIQIL